MPDASYSDRLTGSAWATRRTARTVLGVVHNVTSATRLFDVIPLLAEDSRIQVYFTCTGSSPFTPGALEYLAARDVAVMPWEQAVKLEWDLAVATSHGGDLHKLSGPLIILPHGMGYNKYLESEIGNRKSEIGNRPSVFGMSPDWLLHGGVPIAESLVFSHTEQVDRLRKSCPPAVEIAVVAGDPCLDRMQASMALRGVYRQAIGLRPGQRLILVSSTWGEESLYGRVPDVVGQVRAELPLDEFVMAVALHPAVWSAHSTWQLKQWLAACERSEVVLFPGEEGWRAGLVAADLVIGDYGSVTFYGAALGKPVLLAAWPDHIVDPISPIGKLIAKADRIDHRGPLDDQIRNTISGGLPAGIREIGELATSYPGKSADLLRREFYRLLRLPEPDEPTRTPVVPVARPVRRPATAQAIRVEYTIDDIGDMTATVVRFAAELVAAGRPPQTGTHLVVGTDEPTAGLLQLADVIVHDKPGDAKTWIAETFAALPGVLLAAMPIDDTVWLVGTRNGWILRFTSDSSDCRVWASVVYAWLESGQQVDQFPSLVRVESGGVRFSSRTEVSTADR